MIYYFCLIDASAKQIAALERTIDELRTANASLADKFVSNDDDDDRTTSASVRRRSSTTTTTTTTAKSTNDDGDVRLSVIGGVGGESGATSTTMLHGVELLKLKESELTQARQRVAELAASLNELESEQTLHLAQAKLLKERIRELERTEQRGESVNLEYLKNVVVHYLELSPPTGEQQKRLLPVLSTCLRFSPEEVRRCEAAAVAASATYWPFK